MPLSCQPALGYSIDQLAALITRSFEDYFVPISPDAERMAGLLLSNGVDLRASRVLARGKRAVGLGLIARRGWSCRLAAMGVVVPERGNGAGGWFVRRLLDEAAERGERRMVLEVIEQNARALRLYTGAGFAVRRRLVGFRLRNARGRAHGRLREVDLPEAVARLQQFGAPDLPWQHAPQAFAHAGAPMRAFRLDRAYAIVNAAGTTAVLYALVVEPPVRRRGRATRLLQALIARHAVPNWVVPITFPEEVAPGLFEGLGFQREALSQLQMERALGA